MGIGMGSAPLTAATVGDSCCRKNSCACARQQLAIRAGLAVTLVLQICIMLKGNNSSYWPSKQPLPWSLAFSPGRGPGPGPSFENIRTLAIVLCHTANANATNTTSEGDAHDHSGAGAGVSSTMKGISRQIRQLKVMLKSLLLSEYDFLQANASNVSGLTTRMAKTVELIVFTDNRTVFDEIEWFLYSSNEVHPAYLRPLVLTYAPVVYPPDFEHLKYFFRPCATFRLFLPDVLPAHDSVMYIDTDVIFWKDFRHVYDTLQLLNASQWIAMGPDWYHGGRPPGMELPFYGTQGLNSGVGVYNLTRMRASGFRAALPSIYEQYKTAAEYAGDQDLLNVYFHDRPEELIPLSCGQNYLPHFCYVEGHACMGPLPPPGIAILHGCARAFFPDKAAANSERQFSIIFNEFDRVNLSNLQDYDALMAGMRRKLEENEARPQAAEFSNVCAQSHKFVSDLF